MRVALPDPPDPASDTVAVIAAVVDTARAVVRRAGAARVSEVTGRVAADLAVWVEDDLVTAVVSEPDDFVWLERRTGWFYLPSVAKNAVASRIAKVLSVGGAVRLADLHAGIRRDERMRDFVMPEYILGELCERLPGVRLEGDVVLADPRQSPEDVLERTELTLFRVLVEAGGEAGPARPRGGLPGRRHEGLELQQPHRLLPHRQPTSGTAGTACGARADPTARRRGSAASRRSARATRTSRAPATCASFRPPPRR